MTVGILKAKDIDVGWGGSFSRGLIKASRIGTAVVGGALLAPIIGPAILSGGKVMLGGLKFLGGKLISAPAGLLNVLKSKGIPDFNSASLEQILDGAQQIVPDLEDQNEKRKTKNI